MASLLKVSGPWGDFQVYLDKDGLPWFREKDICRNLGIEDYDHLPRWMKNEYKNDPWMFEKEPCQHFEMMGMMPDEWYWYSDFLWWIVKNIGIADFAYFLEKKFEDTLEQFLET